MRDREAHPDSQYVALKSVRLCLRWNSPLLHEYISNGWCYSTPHDLSRSNSRIESWLYSGDAVSTGSDVRAVQTSTRPNPAPSTTPTSSPHPSIATPLGTRTPPCFSVHFRRTQSNPLPLDSQCHSLADWPQIAQSRKPRPTLAPPDNCEQYPFGTPHPAERCTLPPPVQPNDATRPFSARRSFKSRPDD